MIADAKEVGVVPEVLARVLEPYRDNCKYLKSAAVRVPGGWDPDDVQIRLRGEMSIGESCYIDATGHFNSVEFNICFNQLGFALLGHCAVVESPLLRGYSFEQYVKTQLAEVLILKFESQFSRAMQTQKFTGELVLHRVVEKRSLDILEASCAFYDAEGCASRGNVLIGTTWRRTRAALARSAKTAAAI